MLPFIKRSFCFLLEDESDTMQCKSKVLSNDDLISRYWKWPLFILEPHLQSLRLLKRKESYPSRYHEFKMSIILLVLMRRFSLQTMLDVSWYHSFFASM